VLKKGKARVVYRLLHFKTGTRGEGGRVRDRKSWVVGWWVGGGCGGVVGGGGGFLVWGLEKSA